jgi:two-component system LytT family response regulator
VIIVDDERLARQGIRQLLAAHPEVAVIGEAGRVSTALELIGEKKPDAVFLDIQMPGASGFELLGRAERQPKVVFVTAHSHHAVQAFDVQAIDYLLKPVGPARLASAVQRLKAACTEVADPTPYQHEDRICLRTPQRTIIAKVDNILALEAEGDFTRFHIAGENPLLICRSLAACENTLPVPPFLRVSRSLMVNLSKVKSLEHPTRDEARLSLTGAPGVFSLGRRALARLKKHST